MKSRLRLLLLISSFIVLSAGCSFLRPKPVEFGQAKVKPVPVASPQEVEVQKQAADYLKAKTQETKEKALVTQAAPGVVQAASEAARVADGLSVSLGPPREPWQAEAERLEALLKNQQARFDAQLEAYRKSVAPLVGKKVEGTGILKIGYFTMWAIGFGLLLLIGLGLKIYGWVNPVVGAGMSVVSSVGRVGASVVSKGFAEVVQAGEKFKAYLDRSTLPAEAKAAVVDMFRRAHAEEQTSETKTVIQKMTL